MQLISSAQEMFETSVGNVGCRAFMLYPLRSPSPDGNDKDKIIDGSWSDKEKSAHGPNPVPSSLLGLMAQGLVSSGTKSGP
jgi:hypothetical protein